MLPSRVRKLALPLVLVAGLSACADSGMQPGIVNTATATYASGQGDPGRVVSIRDVSMRGGGGGSGGGPGNGTVMGGVIGGLSGAAIGGSSSRSVGGGLIGLVIGAVGGAIAGTIVDRQAPGRGIEVTVQKDSGQTVTIAQRDDGDVQLGDRVQVVTDRNGVARAVRDNSRPAD